MTPGEFAAKWRGVTTGERASAQSHFLDLCALLGEPGPTEADPTGAWYAFEKGAEKLDGGDGFADVWKRGFFAWEYKGKRKDLKAAYRQLVDYKDALENPPLLVVSDLERIEVRTNFTNLSPKPYLVTLDDLGSADPSEALRVLRAVFTDPEALRPTFDRAQLTEEAARHFAELAGALQGRGNDPAAVAHFLDKLLFCLFAEDTELLPKGLLSRLADATRAKPADFANALGQLFGTMASGGGMFGPERIDWFNGGLFDSAEVLTLTSSEIGLLVDVGRLDWSRIEPAIFGTLFERGLDPSQRTQLGAHYTSRDDIWKLVEPVVLRPLRREYTAMQAQVTQLTLARDASTKKGPDPKALQLFNAFLDRLRAVRILDPACGSGNFLYIALQALKDLELEVIQWGSLVLRTAQQFPGVGPEVVLGIELNPYAAELARVTIWIGEIQWMLGHGFAYRRDPILRPLDSIETKDGVASATISQTYDRNSNVATEGRSFAGISGASGTGTATFTNDQLNRVTADAISGGTSYTYAYDPDGNRTSVTVNAGTPTVATYDATDQLLTEGPQGGTLTSFNYDPYGNMTTSAETFNSGTTAYTYDLGDRLTKISPPASMASAQSFTLDALGRINTETVGSTTTTLSYVGTSKTVSRLATGATNVDSLLGSDGSRLATLAGSSFGWLTPDLHGDVAGASSSSFGTVTDALRYDAFGTISASATSALPTPWRYQGQLLVNPAGASDLYAAGARFYAPGLGAFTQLDTTQGGALNPLSMNRFVYAEANPETFTDPSGHTTVATDDAYNTTITNDATHKHVVRKHLSGRQMYPGLNWNKAHAQQLAERKAQLAGDAAMRRNRAHLGLAQETAQNAATAGVAADNSLSEMDDFSRRERDVNSNRGRGSPYPAAGVIAGETPEQITKVCMDLQDQIAGHVDEIQGKYDAIVNNEKLPMYPTEDSNSSVFTHLLSYTYLIKGYDRLTTEDWIANKCLGDPPALGDRYRDVPSPAVEPPSRTPIIGLGLGYLIYRGIRMIPSLFPPAWETIPLNIVAP